MRKILLGLHGGASAEGAVHVAQLLAERTGASVEAVAVLEPLPIIDYGYGAGYIPDPATEDQLEDELLAEAERQLARCDLEGTKTWAVRGQRSTSIADTAAAHRADLIVVGIGPHHLTDRALGGETALRLAQQASTPVFAVPAGVRGLPRRILVGVDFSAPSLAAARLAASFLAAGDTLALVHVGGAAPTHTGVARRLESFAAQIPVSPGVHRITRVMAGEPTRALLEIAQEINADAVALGSHGYGPWQRLLIGSVSSKVLRLAQCAVLIYPARCVMPVVELEHDAAAAAVIT